MRYGLVTGLQLFRAVEKALEKDEAAVASFRDRLLAVEGVVEERPGGVQQRME
jgi:hypothetical protein